MMRMLLAASQHGGGSPIDITFGRVPPILAYELRVIPVEGQGPLLSLVPLHFPGVQHA